jgi:dipeptidyl aminopeptidase/acylaminoacyl peptidase
MNQRLYSCGRLGRCLWLTAGLAACEGRERGRAERPSPVKSPATGAVTIDELVNRAQIPLLALSPSGRFAAYMLARGNATRDVYDITIRVVDTEKKRAPLTISQYQMPPEETFTQLDWLQPGAGDFRWLDDDKLLLIGKTGNSMRAVVWTASTQKSRTLIEGHDRIALELPNDSQRTVTLVATDFVEPAKDTTGKPVDYSFQMRDGVRFFGPLINPKTGRWGKKQKWIVSLDGEPKAATDGKIIGEWETAPDELSFPPPATTATSMSYPFDETTSPDGKRTVFIEMRETNINRPDSSYGDFRIVLKQGGETKPLTPFIRPYAMARTQVLGFAADGQSVNYLYVAPQKTALVNVTLDGKTKELWSGPELLAKPFPPIRQYQTLSADGRWALLIRSSNLMPGEIVKVDMQTGAATVLEAPNANFTRPGQPQVRFYEVGGTGGDAWGRLYLPADYKPGARYPVVFTQYESSPGFGMETGDEIPFAPLAAHGIAVFDMYSGGLSGSGTAGNFDLDLARVKRPLAGMQWIARKLHEEGIIDPTRIGLSGLSYGTEIAMYSYWNWKTVRAVSSTTGSWDPGVYLFGGPNYTRSLNDRGMPDPDEQGVRTWRRLSAGLNARSDLPPLLLQSPDREENGTTPTWTQLRRVGAQVDWYEYPNEGHVKVHPANRWWVYHRNLDWFRFWLKDEEDADPSKAAQYAKWRQMRADRDSVLSRRGGRG